MVQGRQKTDLQVHKSLRSFCIPASHVPSNLNLSAFILEQLIICITFSSERYGKNREKEKGWKQFQLRSNREISSLHTSSHCNQTSMVVYGNLYLYTSRYLLPEKCHGNIAFVCFPSKCFKQVHNVLNIDFLLFISMFFGFHLFFFFSILLIPAWGELTCLCQ